MCCIRDLTIKCCQGSRKQIRHHVQQQCQRKEISKRRTPKQSHSDTCRHYTNSKWLVHYVVGRQSRRPGKSSEKRKICDHLQTRTHTRTRKKKVSKRKDSTLSMRHKVLSQASKSGWEHPTACAGCLHHCTTFLVWFAGLEIYILVKKSTTECIRAVRWCFSRETRNDTGFAHFVPKARQHSGKEQKGNSRPAAATPRKKERFVSISRLERTPRPKRSPESKYRTLSL